MRATAVRNRALIEVQRIPGAVVVFEDVSGHVDDQMGIRILIEAGGGQFPPVGDGDLGGHAGAGDSHREFLVVGRVQADRDDIVDRRKRDSVLPEQD